MRLTFTHQPTLDGAGGGESQGLWAQQGLHGNEIKLFMAISGRPHGVQKVDVPLLGDKGEAEHVERARP